LQAQGIKSDNYTKTDKIIYIHVRNNPGNLKIKKDSARLKYGVSGRPTLEFSICVPYPSRPWLWRSIYW
jgi:hypothetical protein